MKKILYTTLSLILMFSCVDPNQSGIPKFTVFLEDSPADFKRVDIKLDALELFNGSQWIKLDHVTSKFNILEYTAGSTITLSQHVIANGTYSKIRFTFASKGNTLTSINGITTQLSTDDNSRVVEQPISLEYNNDNKYVMCDMDVAQSIVMTTKDTIFKPVIQIINTQESGAISGAIANDKGLAIAEQFLVKTTSDKGVIKYSYTNPKTGKLFVRLNEGIYTLEIIANTTNKYHGKTINSIQVEKAKATMLGAISLSTVVAGEK